MNDKLPIIIILTGTAFLFWNSRKSKKTMEQEPQKVDDENKLLKYSSIGLGLTGAAYLTYQGGLYIKKKIEDQAAGIFAHG